MAAPAIPDPSDPRPDGPSRRALLAGSAALAGAGLLAGCTSDDDLGEAVASTVPAAGGAGDGSARSVAPAALAALAGRLTGTLLLPDGSEFDAENLPMNDVYEDVRPVAIAMCETPADVAACVDWCRTEGVPPGIRGGGHNYAGASTTRGLLIKTTRMNRVEVDPAAGRVTLQAGALNRDLLAALRNGDWMLPIGTCPTVGVAGLTLGGGIGDNSRWAGMTSDHLVSTDLVVASGETLTASADAHPDLFWGLRGGAGGNFGVNTSLTFDLVRIPRRTITVFGMRVHDRDRIVAAWSAFDRLMQDAPVEMSGFTGITNVAPLGADTAPAPGRTAPYPQLSIDGCFIGDPATARELLAPVVDAAGSPAALVLGEMEYWAAQIDWLAVPDQPKHGFAECSRFTDRAVAPDVLDELVGRVLAAPGGTADAFAEVREMCWSGGSVINGVPADATAYVHRDGTCLLRPAIWWAGAPASLQQDLNDWMAETFAYVSAHARPGSFQNWPYADQVDWQQAYYGSNFARLTEVKGAYDPDGLFRHHQSIPVG